MKLTFSQESLLRAAVVLAHGVPSAGDGYQPPPFLLDAVAQARAAGPSLWPPERKGRVRNMLRHGRYKPSGRGKPASEFLLGAAMEERFPSVSPLVDINNVVSLLSGFPASIFDADSTGPELQVRRGQPGESYAFNPAGHEINLEDLLLVCCRQGDDWVPCGNPVKDSMATKVSDATCNAVAVLYGPLDEPLDELKAWADRYAALLTSDAGATDVRVEVIPA